MDFPHLLGDYEVTATDYRLMVKFCTKLDLLLEIKHLH